MMIKKIRVQPFISRLMCECGGEFQYKGICFPVDPPLYEHVCNKCGNDERLLEVYPLITYEEVCDDDLK